MRLSILILLLTFLSIKVLSQESRTPNFFGINPSVTIEPFYEEGELDVNILPFVYQRPLNLRMHLRLTSIVNLGIRNSGSSLSHLGIETAAPIFF